MRVVRKMANKVGEQSNKISSLERAQALTECLLIGLQAPNEDMCREAGAVADSIAFGLSAAKVEQCKTAALAIWKMQDCATLHSRESALGKF
jgi:hypothetical protein